MTPEQFSELIDVLEACRLNLFIAGCALWFIGGCIVMK